MERFLRCECGHTVRSATDDELIARAQRHAIDVHGMRFSAEQILALARPVVAEVKLDEAAEPDIRR